LNPHQEDCPYPYKELAGCGVAFTLCRGIYKELYNEDYKENIELVALGTIADVVSLTGENRILVKEGMARFLLTPIKGLSALLRITGLVNEDTKEILHADYISFGLAPRLNAAGRITHAKYGVELMTTESGEEAEALAQILCDTNIERQHIEREIYEEALQRIAKLQIQDDLILVIDGKDWHPGVIGIVASRILELYHRPVLVITVRNGVGKGSCRSISAFNIHEALEKMAGFLIQYGGHKMAAGFSIPAEKISEFRKRINDYAKGIITVDDRIPVLELEESLPLDEVNIEFIRSLDLLEPYGSDNPKPLFASFRVFVETARRIGNDRKHFKCRLSQNREPVEAIFWGIGDKDPCCPGDIVDIVYEPEIHDWYGEHVQLICKDIRPVKDYFLTRDFLIDVFVRLRELIPNSKSVAVFEIQNRLKRSFEGKYSRQCLCTALSVFEELNILYRFNRNGVDYYQRKVINKKLDLLSSSIYRKYRK
jgi:single-stranded-DNA-specific exonuclease